MSAPAAIPNPTPPQPRRRHCTVSTMGADAARSDKDADKGTAPAEPGSDETLPAIAAAASILVGRFIGLSPLNVRPRPLTRAQCSKVFDLRSRRAKWPVPAMSPHCDRLPRSRPVWRRPSMTGRADSACHCAGDIDRLSQPAFELVLAPKEKATLVGDPALGRIPGKFAVPSRNLGIARRAQGRRLLQARRPEMAQRGILDAATPAALEE